MRGVSGGVRAAREFAGEGRAGNGQRDGAGAAADFGSSCDLERMRPVAEAYPDMTHQTE